MATPPRLGPERPSPSRPFVGDVALTEWVREPDKEAAQSIVECVPPAHQIDK